MLSRLNQWLFLVVVLSFPAMTLADEAGPLAMSFKVWQKGQVTTNVESRPLKLKAVGDRDVQKHGDYTLTHELLKGIHGTIILSISIRDGQDRSIGYYSNYAKSVDDFVFLQFSSGDKFLGHPISLNIQNIEFWK